MCIHSWHQSLTRPCNCACIWLPTKWSTALWYQHCVDPTFSLGEFEVTPVTYRHLLLESRRTGKSPICVGPILIHYRKTFPTYLFFSSSMFGLQRELVNVKSFGTDGEEALSDAFSHGFKYAVHLTCQIHKRRNVEAKLKDMGFPLEARHHILDDIFGKQRGDTFYERSRWLCICRFPWCPAWNCEEEVAQSRSAENKQVLWMVCALLERCYQKHSVKASSSESWLGIPTLAFFLPMLVNLLMLFLRLKWTASRMNLRLSVKWKSWWKIKRQSLNLPSLTEESINYGQLITCWKFQRMFGFKWTRRQSKFMLQSSIEQRSRKLSKKQKM